MQKLYSHFLFILAAIIWGASFTYQLPIVNKIGAINYTFYTFFISFVIVFVISIIKNYKLMYRWREGLLLGILLAGLEITQMIGLKGGGATETSFISNLGMIVVPFFGALLFRHKLKRVHVLILGVACIGLYFFTGADLTFSVNQYYLLISATFMALYFLFTEKYSSRSDVNFATSLMQTFFIVALVSFYFIYKDYESLQAIPIYNESTYIYLLIQSIAFTLIPYAFISLASRVSEDLDVSYYEGIIEPIAGAAFAYIVLNEKLVGVQVIGAYILLLAFVLGVYGLRRRS